MDGMFTDDSSAIEITTGGNAAPRYLTTENSPRLLLVDDEPRLARRLGVDFFEDAVGLARGH